MKLCFTANVLIFETNDAVKNDLKVTKTSQTIQSNPFRFVALAFLLFFFFGGGQVTKEIKSNWIQSLKWISWKLGLIVSAGYAKLG